MHTNQVNRRKALAVVAAAPAAVALSAPAVAKSSDDAALLALWRKWNAKRAERDTIGKQSRQADEECYNRAMDQISTIVEEIAETPAEGPIGVAVKLAVCMDERDFMQHPATELVESALAQFAGLLNS